MGRVSHSDNVNINERKTMIGRTIDIENNYCSNLLINEYSVKNKLVIEKCSRV